MGINLAKNYFEQRKFKIGNIKDEIIWEADKGVGKGEQTEKIAISVLSYDECDLLKILDVPDIKKWPKPDSVTYWHCGKALVIYH